MPKISILDCTLRDGGYVNNFEFGQETICNIIKKLSNASIDIIECGFLREGSNNREQSLFDSVGAIQKVIGKKNKKILYVAMIQYGAIKIEDIEEYTGKSIDGIRLTFHQSEIDEAITFGKQLMSKGYKLFMQPVGTTTYSDVSLIKLLQNINKLNPFAFYIVDTLGTMFKKDLLRMYYLVDYYLNDEIMLGFHSHNNLQMSFSNAQELIEVSTMRHIIIDASVLGMGRGAGNLNTELITNFINVNFGFRYDCSEILDIIDQYIRPLSYKYKWGYDAVYYIAAIAKCHPNYAAYLMNLQTLNVKDINFILKNMECKKKGVFDKDYIQQEYLQYMNHAVDDADTQRFIKELIGERKVLIIAPGKSVQSNIKKIKQIIKENFFVICVNFCPKELEIVTNLIFISNLKRFEKSLQLEKLIKNGKEIVITSNINNVKNEKINVINYSSYLNEDICIMDNAGLMCINFLKKLGIKRVSLIGFDGFSEYISENYYNEKLCMNVDQARLLKMNAATEKKIEQLKTQMDIKFLTKSIYDV